MRKGVYLTSSKNVSHAPSLKQLNTSIENKNENVYQPKPVGENGDDKKVDDKC